MPPPFSVSTVVVSTPPSMAPVPSGAKFFALFVLPGTRTFPMPPMQAALKPPLRVQLLPLLYRLLQPGTAPVSLPLANLPNPRLLDSLAAHPPSLTWPLPSPSQTSLVPAVPSSQLAPVWTRVCPHRLTSTWSFRCRQTPIQHRVLHYPMLFITLVV